LFLKYHSVMKQILIPTDFSDNSWNAIEYTLALFGKVLVHIHLLHIAYTGGIDTDAHLHTNGVVLADRARHSKEKKLLALKQKIQSLYSGENLKIEVFVLHFSFVEGIKHAVQEKNIDLIIMGTKGASALKEATIGSHTGAVITRVKCPILVIPEKAVFETPENIAFPTDFNILYRQRIMDTLFEIAALHDSSIKVLRVANEEYTLNAEQEKNRNFLIDALEARSFSFHWIKSPGLEEGLQSFVDIMDIQIIAMVAKNLNFFQRLLFKPTVAKISYHTKIPFLVLHE